MSPMASQITSLTIVCSTVYSGADQRKHQSSAPLAFVWGIQRWSLNSSHEGPVKFAENVSIWWRHHAVLGRLKVIKITSYYSMETACNDDNKSISLDSEVYVMWSGCCTSSVPLRARQKCSAWVKVFFFSAALLALRHSAISKIHS